MAGMTLNEILFAIGTSLVVFGFLLLTVPRGRRETEPSPSASGSAGSTTPCRWKLDISISRVPTIYYADLRQKLLLVNGSRKQNLKWNRQSTKNDFALSAITQVVFFR